MTLVAYGLIMSGEATMQEARLALLAFRNCLSRGYLTLRPPGCIMSPIATFLNSVYTIKTTQYCRQFGTPLTVTFPRAACKPARHIGGVLCYKMF